MRILYFAQTFPPATRGGVAYSSFALCRELARSGLDVKVITTDRDGKDGKFRLNVPLNIWNTYDNLSVVYCSTLPGAYLFSSNMRSFAEEEVKKCDVIISASILWDYSGWLVDKLALKYKKPHIVYLHGVLDPWAFGFKKYRKQFYWKLFGRNILTRASRIIALTENEKNAIRQFGIKTPVTIIPNGINPEDFSDVMSRKELEENYPRLKKCSFLLYMSRIHPKKGLDILLPAFDQATSGKQDDLLLVIAGHVEDIYKYEFDKLLSNHRSQKIMLVGHVKGMVKNSLLRYASGFILTSYSEGLPIAVLEALSVGCPVIISRQCNIPEVSQSNAGWIVSNDIAEVSRAIRELRDDKEKTRMRGRNAELLIKERFAWGIIAKETIEALNLTLTEAYKKQ